MLPDSSRFLSACPVVCRVAQKERSKEKIFDLSRAFLSVYGPVLPFFRISVRLAGEGRPVSLWRECRQNENRHVFRKMKRSQTRLEIRISFKYCVIPPYFRGFCRFVYRCLPSVSWNGKQNFASKLLIMNIYIFLFTVFNVFTHKYIYPCFFLMVLQWSLPALFACRCGFAACCWYLCLLICQGVGVAQKSGAFPWRPPVPWTFPREQFLRLRGGWFWFACWPVSVSCLAGEPSFPDNWVFVQCQGFFWLP